MPFYNLLEQDYQNHLELHILGRPINKRKGYCSYCFPEENLPISRIPYGFHIFWLWISEQYSANQYSGYTLATYKLLENNINTAVDLSFIANITTRLLQSIQFQILSVSFLELCYYIHKLFILTNGFSA